MFLSKIELDTRFHRDPYQWHKALWTLFPDQPSADRPFLFSVDRRARYHASLEILLQSTLEPVSGGEGLRLRGTKQFDPRPRAAQVLHFRLTANPVKTIPDRQGSSSTASKPKSCRVPLIGQESLQEWLGRKLSSAATILDSSLLVQPRPPLYFRRGGRPGKIVPVDYEGLLTVTDPEKLLDLLGRGIGPAKAFGCGLMLVRRC